MLFGKTKYLIIIFLFSSFVFGQNSKISDLPIMYDEDVATDDLFVIVDSSVSTTKKFEMQSFYDLFLRRNVDTISTEYGGTGQDFSSATGALQFNTGTASTGTLPVMYGGTGAVTEQAAIDNLLPDQSGNSGGYLTTNGTTSSWALFAPPTVQRFTSSSGTYNTPVGVRLIRVRMVGGGGGGGGAGTSGTTTGSGGGNTTFGTATANGGSGGALLSDGTGGGASIPDYTIIHTAEGGRGGAGQISGSPSGGEQPSGGQGGDSQLGTGGGAGSSGGGGSNAPSNSGGGGGGGGADNVNNMRTGGGGGAGGYAEFWISNPASSYAYSVGAGGSGGPAGSGSVRTGGNGGAGLIIIEEYY